MPLSSLVRRPILGCCALAPLLWLSTNGEAAWAAQVAAFLLCGPVLHVTSNVSGRSHWGKRTECAYFAMHPSKWKEAWTVRNASTGEFWCMVNSWIYCYFSVCKHASTSIQCKLWRSHSTVNMAWLNGNWTMHTSCIKKQVFSYAPCGTTYRNTGWSRNTYAEIMQQSL